jgi:hypothetical protein
VFRRRCHRSHAVQATLMFVQTVWKNVLMLIVMTGNGWLFFSVVAGTAVGYHLCSAWWAVAEWRVASKSARVSVQAELNPVPCSHAGP